jgi:hypothetical protein
MSSARRSKARAVEPTEHAAPGASPKPQTAPLPVPLIETGVAPVVTESAQLNADLGELSRAVDDAHEPPFGSLGDLAKYEKADLARIRRQLAVASKPARTDEIAHEAGRIVVSVPIANSIDPGVLAGPLRGQIIRADGPLHVVTNHFPKPWKQTEKESARC